MLQLLNPSTSTRESVPCNERSAWCSEDPMCHNQDPMQSNKWIQFSSVQFSHSVMSDSLQPHESQHTRPPCSSPTPRAHSDSHPSSQWCQPAISSSDIPFSSCPQSLPASESFPVPMGICCMSQETQTRAVYQPRGVEWGGKWEGGSKERGYMYTYGWFMLRFDRKQQSSVKQLSFS